MQFKGDSILKEQIKKEWNVNGESKVKCLVQNSLTFVTNILALVLMHCYLNPTFMGNCLCRWSTGFTERNDSHGSESVWRGMPSAVRISKAAWSIYRLTNNYCNVQSQKYK